ncbi:MAG: hypothetical protein GEV07_10120 [Streptosporangiales bacterium]|nr:hypothetical protein [Streptosporangiales bacterium]
MTVRPDRLPTVRYLPLPAGWPLYALLGLFPVWWALGLGEFILPLLALPMAVGIWRRRPVRVPRGFALWLLFLCWVAISVAALNLEAPDTLSGDVATRTMAAGYRMVNYVAVTVVILYLGNLTEEELPKRRVVALLGVFFLQVVLLGCVALLWPQGEFASPFELLLPESLRNNGFVSGLVHPQLAQNMAVLGDLSARPAAPFPYTNAWGNVTSVLLVWFVAWQWARRTTGHKVFAAVGVAVAAIPVIYSVNRGVWIGLLVALVYVAARMALRGNVRVLAGIVTAVVVGGAVIVATPLQGVVVERLNNPHSDQGRFAQDKVAVVGALHSPVIGYGSTRNMAGSRQSIAIGKSASCPKCGNSSTGGAGHIWLLLFAHGFVGAALYLGFFGYNLWRHRRDYTPIGVAASTVLVLSFVYLPFYGAIGMPLTLSFVAMGLLWRNAQPAGEVVSS